MTKLYPMMLPTPRLHGTRFSGLHRLDAAFGSVGARPADIRLHYIYGVAATRCWGKHSEALTKFSSRQPPPIIEAAALGPTKTVDDRQITTEKLDRAQSGGGRGFPPDGEGGASSGAVADPEQQV
jgi:hypothetical protein